MDTYFEDTNFGELNDSKPLSQHSKGDLSKFPQYVMMGGTTALRLCTYDKPTYHRAAGCWEVDAAIRDGKIITVYDTDIHPQLNGKELVEITKEEHDADNKGYV